MKKKVSTQVQPLKKNDLKKQYDLINQQVELAYYQKIKQMELDLEFKNRASNRNRARSFNVGTAFGGTTEIMMRGDGGRHIWCTLQPVEVVELIHQLAGNVGVNIDVKPRKDFAAWRDWRVSEAEKKHLNGHPPFVNDMAVFQQLGASGYNDEEAKKIMNIIANANTYANDNDETNILLKERFADGAPNIMVGKEDGLIHNKLIIEDEKIVYVSGGSGGLDIIEESELAKLTTKENGKENKNETLASNKPKNKRKVG